MSDPLFSDEALLAAVIERPAADRAAFLDGACAGDPARRARLGVLLREAIAAQPAPVTADMRASGQQELPGRCSEEEIGAVIGRYKLLEKVGEGGFGVVYVAEQREPVKRRVALKIIKLGMDTRQVVARFEAERQALALMDHPNIAKVLDAGATDTGRPYFVMELVRGIKITEYCDLNNLSTGARLDLFVATCHAIQHAHQKGIIHRDIKPSNILVTLHDGVPVPKVIDFGIAKATQGELTDKTVYTQLQQCIGTPAYMSPEQAEMSGLDVDTRSDIYSLGVLLYELLTGGTPFDREELAKAGWDEVRRTIREKEPLRPSTRLSKMQPANATELAKRRGVDVPRLVALLRGDLDWIVMRCLEKDRTRRYETASGVAQDIKRHLHHEPVAARPPSAAYRFRKLVRRNRLAVAAAGAVLLVLVLGIVGSTWQAVRATRAEREQIRFRMQAQANEQKALAAEALEASQRQEAEAARRQAQGNAYAAEMNLAQEAYAEGRLARAVSLLENHVPGPGKAEDLRGFEWRYLWRICHEGDALVTTPAEKSPVAAVGFTASGQLVTCSSVGVVSVFDLASRKHSVRFGMQGTADAVPIPSKAEAAPALGNVRLRRWELHTRLAVSRNGEVVAGAFGEGVISLCRIAEKPESLTVPVDGGRPGIALSPDGRLLAFPAEKGIRLWDCIQRRELGLVPGQRRSGLLMFSRDGSLLAKGEGSAVQIIDVTNRAELFRLEALHTAEVLAGAFSPDGRTLATSGWDTSIKLTDLASRQVIASLRGNTTHAWHLEFSPDGRTLATAGDSEVVTIWDVSDRTAATPIRTLRGHRDKVTALAFSADGKTVATGSADGTAKVSRIDETSSDLLEGHDQWAFSVAFSPESKVLASGSFDGTIRFWDSRTGNPTAVIRAAPSSVYTVAFTPDGRLLAGCEARWYSTPSTTRTRNRIRLWKVADQSEVLSLAEGTFPRALDISPDGRILAGGDAAPMGQVTLWDIPSGKEIANIKTPRSGNSTVRFSPDGRFLATSGYMGEAKLWNVATRQEIARFDSENESFGPNVDFSPDSQTLAIGWYELELWSTEDHRPLVKLAGHRAPIMSVRYSPDGKTIATGSMDHSVKLWNVATRREVATLQGHTGAVSGLAFSADGTMLASSSEDKTIRIWRAISAAEAAALKSR